MSNVVPIIGQFLHPPIGLCALELITDTHSDRVVYTRPRGPVQVDAFGIEVVVTSWPPGYGVDSSTGREIFDRTVIHLEVLHKLADGSTLFTDDVETRNGSLRLMFTESFPESVSVWTSPGVVASVRWILLLVP
jgi:hypothetical protein